MRRASVLYSALFALVFAVFGCASSSAPQQGDQFVQHDSIVHPDFGVPDAIPARLYKLTIVGWQKITLQQGQQVVLQVRLTNNEESAPNQPVSFAFKGAVTNSTLSTLTAITDAQGFAETTLTAGQTLASFQVEAANARATPVYWDITVEKKPETPPVVAKLAGTFSVDNKFEIVGKFSGSNLADILNLLEDISDDPEDPGKWFVDLILDQIQSKVNNDTFNQISNLFRTLLYSEMNKLLKNITLVQDLKDLAADLSALARRFEILSRMESAVPQDASLPMTVKHTLDRIKWTLDGKTVAYTFAQLGMSDPEVPAVTLTLTNGQNLAIDKHAFDLKFGAFLLVGLNALVIPKINGQAKSITDLMKGWVDCQKLGTTLDNATNNLIGPTIWTQGCESGLTMGGSYLENQIIKLGNDTSRLEIQGQCKISDMNNDGFYDAMTDGVWTGTFTMNGSPVVIAGPGNSFTGARTK